MAKARLPKVKPKITKAQQRILDKYKNIVESYRAPDYKPRFGAGSRGPTGTSRWNVVQTKTAELSKKYDLKKTESASLRGLSRRLNNIQKLIKQDESIRNIFEKRWAMSDAKEQFDYKDFADLTAEELVELQEMYVAFSGIMDLPNLHTPDPDKTTVKWNS